MVVVFLITAQSVGATPQQPIQPDEFVFHAEATVIEDGKVTTMNIIKYFSVYNQATAYVSTKAGVGQVYLLSCDHKAKVWYNNVGKIHHQGNFAVPYQCTLQATRIV